MIIYGIKLEFIKLLSLLASKTLDDVEATEYVKQCFGGILLVKLDSLISALQYYKISEWLQDNGLMKLLNKKHDCYDELCKLSVSFRFIENRKEVIVGVTLASSMTYCDLEVEKNRKVEELDKFCKMLGLEGHRSYYFVM